MNKVLLWFSLYFFVTTLICCSGEKSFDGVPVTETSTPTPTPTPTSTPTPSGTPSYSGYVVVATITTEPTTGPGIVTMFDTDKQVFLGGPLKDYFPLSRWATGTSFLPPDTILMANTNNTTNFVDAINLTSGALSNFNLGPVLAGTFTRTMATDFTDNSVYVVESNNNRIRKYDSAGNPSLTISASVTTGAFTCTLNSPYGIAVISTTQNIAVISSAAAGRLSLYDKDGNCLGNTITTAPLNANTPAAIAYHATTNKLLITFAVSHAIYAANTDGSGMTQIYLNSAIINTPRAITTDSSGFIYVGSSGTDTIEKLSWSGTGGATRVGSGPFLGPSIYTQNPTSITVIP